MPTDVEVPVVPEVEIEPPETTEPEINVEEALNKAAELVPKPEPVVPEKYDLKVKEGVTVDPALLERTAAIARTLGLGQEKAQQLLDVELADYAANEKAWNDEQAALKKSQEPGGTAYEQRKADWIRQAMQDPYIVGNQPTPEKWTVITQKVQQALQTTDARPSMIKMLEKSGLMYHPEFIGYLVNLSRKTSEGRLVLGGSPNASVPKTQAQILYPKDYEKSA